MPADFDRNSAIARQIASWQSAFHDLYDANPPAENDGPRPNPPEELGSDFRLLTGFSWLTPQTRAACLAHLPQGADLVPLVEDWLGPAAPLSEVEAKALVHKGLDGVLDALKSMDLHVADAWMEFGDRLGDMASQSDQIAVEAAYYFLNELMYWQGSSYTASYFVCWQLLASDQPNPASPFVQLEKGGWRAVWSGTEWGVKPR